ncbi:MAG: hypothetical protein KDH92_08730, partial [Chloroflexi bacterium]|nr:hypothetical protein [Chloroflexota bacterium]
MEHPQAADGTRSIVELTTDFLGYEDRGAGPLGRLGSPGAWLDDQLASAGRAPALAQLSLLALVLGLAAALLRLWQRQPRRAYRIFASFMAFQLAFSSPILALTQSRQLQRFFERFPSTRSLRVAEASEIGSPSPFDFRPRSPRPPAARSAGGSTATTAIASAPRPALPPAALAAQAKGLPDADEDGLSDALEAVWGTRPDDPDSDNDSISDYDETIRCPYPEPRLAVERDANAASYACPNPTRYDTDGDRLSDGEELLHIGTQVNHVDTDGDRISDYNEVKGFAFGGGREYSDARNPDSDRDGLPDGIECPSLRDAEDPGPSFAPSWTPELSCRDSQATGRPDSLNLDDDGDGVPSREDLSPLAPTAGPFDAEHPMTLELAGLRQDLPVLLQIQLRPTDPKQLSFARNVLDWPSGDNQGQIQRQIDSTIGSVFGPDDPSDPAYAGDMRLVPMLQIHMPGDARDLKRIPARATIALNDAGQRVGRLNFSNQLDAEDEIVSAQVTLASLVGTGARLDLAKGICDTSSPVFGSAVAEGQTLALP